VGFVDLVELEARMGGAQSAADDVDRPWLIPSSCVMPDELALSEKVRRAAWGTPENDDSALSAASSVRSSGKRSRYQP